jgi:hypothetical protein
LPAAGNQGYGQASYDLAYHYGRAQVSGQSIHKTSNSAGAFLQAMKSELDGLRDDLALDFARQVYGTGDGVIASLAANTTVNTLVLQDAEAVSKGFIYINMVIDIGDTSNPISVAQGRTVTDINLSTPSITISGATVTTTTSHRVFRTGNAGPSTTYALREMDAGLQKLISTSANTVGGINAAGAGNGFWDNLRDTTGGAISLSTLMRQWNRAASGGAKVGNAVALTTPGLIRRLFETNDFKALIQFVNTKEFAGGFSEVSFAANGSPVRLYPDRLAPWGKVLRASPSRATSRRVTGSSCAAAPMVRLIRSSVLVGSCPLPRRSSARSTKVTCAVTARASSLRSSAATKQSAARLSIRARADDRGSRRRLPLGCAQGRQGEHPPQLSFPVTSRRRRE